MNTLKSFKKLLSIVLLAAVAVMALPAAAYADDVAPEPAEVLPLFGSFAGTITHVAYPVGSTLDVAPTYVFVEDASGSQVRFAVTGDTYKITEGRLTLDMVGLSFIGFYDARLPVPMIYPPQYTAVAIAVDLPAGQSVKVDRFDEDLISFDNTLKLNIADTTEIVFEDGMEFPGDLEILVNRKLIVVYDISTRSIPAQTTPLKVVILYEKAVHPIYTFDDPADISGGAAIAPPIFIFDEPVYLLPSEIIVNDVIIDAPFPYMEDGVTMVPLRVIAEALGFEVRWEAATQSIMLNNVISLRVGEDYYTYARMAPIQLGTAPVLTPEGLTFVPLSFFSEVVRVSVDIERNQLIISDLESALTE